MRWFLSDLTHRNRYYANEQLSFSLYDYYLLNFEMSKIEKFGIWYHAEDFEELHNSPKNYKMFPKTSLQMWKLSVSGLAQTSKSNLGKITQLPVMKS